MCARACISLCVCASLHARAISVCAHVQGCVSGISAGRGPECRARVGQGRPSCRSPGCSRSFASRSPAREGVRPAVSSAVAQAAVPDSGAASKRAAMAWGDADEWGRHGSAHPTRTGLSGGEGPHPVTASDAGRPSQVLRRLATLDGTACESSCPSPPVEPDERRVASRCHVQQWPSTQLHRAAPSGRRFPISRLRLRTARMSLCFGDTALPTQ